MPGLLPILLVGSNLMLVADRIPEFNVEPSCRASTTASAMANRDENACKADENKARGQLEQSWAQYTPTQRSHCTQLSTLGGPASYVELATCLELAKAASELPHDMLDSKTVSGR